MWVCWDSDREARLAGSGRVGTSPVAHVSWRAVLALAAAVACLASVPADAARRDRDDDSARVTRKIVVDDQGIEIVREHADRKVVRADGGRVRITVDPKSADGRGKPEVDVDVDLDEGDTLTFDDGGVRIGPTGIVIDGDEDAGMVRMFSDAEVHPGEHIQGDVVAVFGDVLVEGQVSGNVVAVFGSVRLEPGARIEGDAVAVGGVLDQPPGAAVGGESVSLGFLPMRWGAPSIGVLVGVTFVCWLVSLFVGWILLLLFPGRMVRTAATASRRTGGSLVLGLVSGPMLIITIVLLLVTVIGIPVAFVLPLVYLIALWAGQLALTYALGCRLLRRRLGHGGTFTPLAAGSLFVAAFFVLGALLGATEGVVRTIALFFHLLGFLLIMGLSVIGIGAFILSRMGTRPRDLEAAAEGAAGPALGPSVSTPAPGAPGAPLAPPAI